MFKFLKTLLSRFFKKFFSIKARKFPQTHHTDHTDHAHTDHTYAHQLLHKPTQKPYPTKIPRHIAHPIGISHHELQKHHDPHTPHKHPIGISHDDLHNQSLEYFCQLSNELKAPRLKPTTIHTRYYLHKTFFKTFNALFDPDHAEQTHAREFCANTTHTDQKAQTHQTPKIHIPISQITPTHIQALVNAFLSKNLHPATIRQLLSYANDGFSLAQELHIITQNPTRTPAPLVNFTPTYHAHQNPHTPYNTAQQTYPKTPTTPTELIHTAQKTPAPLVGFTPTHQKTTQNPHTPYNTTPLINFTPTYHATQNPHSPYNTSHTKLIAISHIKKLLSHATGELKTFLYFAFYTGARIGEILAITQKDIDYHHNHIIIYKNATRYGTTTPKNGKPRIIYLAPQLKSQLLSTHFQHFQSGYFSIYYQFKKLKTTLKLNIHSPHAIRHTFASLCLQNNLNLPLIAKILGHSDISMLSKVYSHYIYSKKDQLKLKKILDFK